MENLDTLADRLRWARKQRKFSQERLAELSNVTQPTISKIEKGAIEKPAELLALARGLSINPDWLDTGDGDWDRRAAAQPSNVATAPALRTPDFIPVVGHVKAGTDGFLEELGYPVGHGDGKVEYWTRDTTAYALKVKGDSMHPRYRAGEFIVVTPGIEAQPGWDVVVKLKDGRKLLKQYNWMRGGEVQLLSINNGYAPMTISLAEVESIHRVAGGVPPDALEND